MQNTVFSPLKSLQALIRLFPVQGAIVIGAGMGKGAWFDLFLQQRIEDVVLIEAEPANVKYLERKYAACTKWRILQQVIGEREAEEIFYSFTNSAESSLLSPDALQALWPNISIREEQLCKTVSIDWLIKKNALQANWLIIDALPTLSLLNGAANTLTDFDVIILRQVTDEHLSSGLYQDIGAYMQLNDLSCFGIETEVHPAIGHAIYIRDLKKQEAKLKESQALLVQLQEKGHERQSAWEQEKRKLTENLKEVEQQFAGQKQSSKELIQRLQEARQALVSSKNEQQELAQRSKNEAEQKEKHWLERQNNWNQEKIELLKTQKDIEQKVIAEKKGIEELKQCLVVARQELTASKKGQQELSERLKNESEIDKALLNVHENYCELQETLKKQACISENLKEVEKRLSSELTKGFANTIKQIEAFLSIQNYINYGELLTSFHNWLISPDIGLFLLEKMHEQHYDLIIEFGSGTSTALLAKGIEVISRFSSEQDEVPSRVRTEIVSFEHNEIFYEKTQQILDNRGLAHLVQLFHAPLIEWHDGEEVYSFYDCKSILELFASKYADQKIHILLVVDGPPAATCSNARYPAIPFVFNNIGQSNIDVVLDDANRKEEKAIIELWRGFWEKRSLKINDFFLQGEKGIYLSCVRGD